MEKKTLMLDKISDIYDNLSLIKSLESNNIDLKGELIDKIQKDIRREMSNYFTIEQIEFYTNYDAPGKSLGIQGNFNSKNLETFLMHKSKDNCSHYYCQIQISFEEMKYKKLSFRFVLMDEREKTEDCFEKEYREIDFEKILEKIHLKYIENGICENITIEESNLYYIYNFSTRSLIIIVQNIENNFEGENLISMLINDF